MSLRSQSFYASCVSGSARCFGYAEHYSRSAWERRLTPKDGLLSASTLEPVPRPQLPIETENVLPGLLVTGPDQPVELTKPAIP